MPPLLGVQGAGADHAPNGFGKGEPGEDQLRVSPVQPGEGEEILNDVGHPVRLRDDNVQEVVGGVQGDVPLGVPEGLGIGPDIGQGSPELVGDVGHEFLSPLLVPVLLRHVVKDDEDTSPLPVGEGSQIDLQGLVPGLQLPLGEVGPLEGQHLLEGVNGAEELVIGALGTHGALEHVVGGGVAVDELAVVGEGHHAVGHVEKKGVQLVPLVLHGGQSGLEHSGHFVKGAGEDANLVGGLHGQGAAEIPGGHPLRSGGEFFDGVHHGFGEEEAQKHGDQKADEQGLHDDDKELLVESGYGVPVVQDIDDEGVAAAEDGDGGVHIVGGDVADVADAGLIPPEDGVPGGEKIGALLPGHGAFVGGAAQVSAGGAVQDEVVSAAVIDAQPSGGGVHHLLNTQRAVLLGGLAPEGGDEFPLVRAEDAVDLLIEGVGKEAGDVDGQESSHHHHQGGD